MGIHENNYQDKQMIKVQGDIIAKLNKEIKTCGEKLNDADKLICEYKPKAQMYDQIIEMVIQFPILQNIWDEFTNTMKLCDAERFNK